MLDLYIFDRKLRLLTLDAIEKIEVSLKAQIDDVMSTKYGCFRYNKQELFTLENETFQEMYGKIMEKITITKEKSGLAFIRAYNQKYYEEKFLPSRMALESCTIGSVSLILSILNREDVKEIAGMYVTSYKDLRRWIQFAVNVRNVVAHHERLWNRNFNAKPRKNDVVFKHKYKVENGEVISNFFNFSLIVHHLLWCISPNNDWLQKLEYLFDEYPTIPK